MKKASLSDELDRFERAVSDAFAILAGMLAEVAGPKTVALQFRAAREGAAVRRADPVRDRLLRDAYRLVLIKARNADPGDPEIQSLCATELAGGQTKH